MLVKLTKSNVSLYLKYQKKHLKKKNIFDFEQFYWYYYKGFSFRSEVRAEYFQIIGLLRWNKIIIIIKDIDSVIYKIINI